MPLHEGKLTQKLLKELKELGCLCLKLHGHAMQASGWPDALIIHKRFICFIEFKVGNNKLSALQTRMIDLISQRGVKCFIVTFINELLEIRNYKNEQIAVVMDAKGLFEVLSNVTQGDS